MWIGIDESACQTNHIHNLAYAFLDAILVLMVIDFLNKQGRSDRFANRHARVERCKRILEDNLHVTTHIFHLLIVERKNILLIKIDFAAGRFMQAENGTAHCRLAAAGFTDNAKRFTLFNGKANIIYRVEHAVWNGEVFFQVFYLQNFTILFCHIFSPLSGRVPEAAHLMTVFQLRKFRRRHAAMLGGILTAVSKFTALRQRSRVRHHAVDGGQATAVRFQIRDRAEQAFSIRMHGVFIDLT